MNNKKIDLLRKLKALAERGVGGEKTNAEKIFKDTLEKYGISEDELEFSTKERRIIKCTATQYDIGFLGQIVAHIIEDPKVYSYTNNSTGRITKTKVAVECTVKEQIELQATLDFFWDRYQEELQHFYKAFIVKNHLFPKSPGRGKPIQEDENWQKIQQMSQGIDFNTMKKQIE